MKHLLELRRGFVPKLAAWILSPNRPWLILWTISLLMGCWGSSAFAEFRIFKSEAFYLTDRFPGELLLAEGLKMKAIDKALAQCRADQQTLCEVKASNLAFERHALASRVRAQAVVHSLRAPQLQIQQKYTAVRNFYRDKGLEADELQGIKKIALDSAMAECQQFYLFCSFESAELTQSNTIQTKEDEHDLYITTGKAVVVGYPPEESSFLSTSPSVEELDMDSIN